MSLNWGMGIGDWGLGIGDWGLGPITNPQYPIPSYISKNINIKIEYSKKFLSNNLIKIINKKK